MKEKTTPTELRYVSPNMVEKEIPPVRWSITYTKIPKTGLFGQVKRDRYGNVVYDNKKSKTDRNLQYFFEGKWIDVPCKSTWNYID